MRRAAGCASTGSASSTAFKHFATRGHSILQLQYTPSALVYTSSASWSAGARKYSSQTAEKPAQWTVSREESRRAATHKARGQVDGRLGQEEGQRLIEAAFSSKEPIGSKATSRTKKPKQSKKPKQARNSKKSPEDSDTLLARSLSPAKRQGPSDVRKRNNQRPTQRIGSDVIPQMAAGRLRSFDPKSKNATSEAFIPSASVGAQTIPTWSPPQRRGAPGTKINLSLDSPQVQGLSLLPGESRTLELSLRPTLASSRRSRRLSPEAKFGSEISIPLPRKHSESEQKQGGDHTLDEPRLPVLDGTDGTLQQYHTTLPSYQDFSDSGERWSKGGQATRLSSFGVDVSPQNGGVGPVTPSTLHVRDHTSPEGPATQDNFREVPFRLQEAALEKFSPRDRDMLIKGLYKRRVAQATRQRQLQKEDPSGDMGRPNKYSPGRLRRDGMPGSSNEVSPVDRVLSQSEGQHISQGALEGPPSLILKRGIAFPRGLPRRPAPPNSYTQPHRIAEVAKGKVPAQSTPGLRPEDSRPDEDSRNASTRSRIRDGKNIVYGHYSHRGKNIPPKLWWASRRMKDQKHQVTWTPRIRESFMKHGTAEPDPDPARGTKYPDQVGVREPLPHQLDYSNLLPYGSLPQRVLGRVAPENDLDHGDLVAEIRQKAHQYLPPSHDATLDQQEKESLDNDPLLPTSTQVVDPQGSPVTHSVAGRRPNTVSGWERLAIHINDHQGPEAAWESMAPLRHDDRSLLAHPDAEGLRGVFLQVATSEDVRLNEFVQIVTSLRDDYEFEWRDLYGNVVYSLLDADEPSRAVFWHSRLFFSFSPTEPVFTALLSHFAVDSSSEMQTTLMKLHDSRRSTKLYDSIIPRLFEWGQSELARAWRKRLLAVNDVPTTEASLPFLRFLSAYYPSIELSTVEQAVFEFKGEQPPVIRTKTETELEEIKKSIQRDHIVAKWFASSWTTLDFAVDMVHRFGVLVMGPLALQSLGLREPGAKNLTDRIAQLERHGVGIAQMTYCRVLVHFARGNNDALLETLLACDVHPDEFEDIQTVRMLASAAERRQDVAQQRLMREVEKTMQILSAQDEQENETASKDHPGNLTGRLTHAQCEAAEILDIAFEGLGAHPSKWLERDRTSGRLTQLEQVVAGLRRAFADDVAIPLEYWNIVLRSFGRLGRFEQLEQLCLEFVQIYSPIHERLIPVHPSDIPVSKFEDKPQRPNRADSGRDDNADGLEMWQRALEGAASGSKGYGYVPSDLPFSHRQHPVQKLFHQKLQRNIIRWGFDRALRFRHSGEGSEWRDSMRNTALGSVQVSEGGLAQGLRILAKLRDAGVLIDVQIIQSEVVRRIIAADFPGRDKAPWMDSHELAIPYIARLVKEVWGPGIFEGPEELKQKVQARADKVQDHYWGSRLFRSPRSRK